MTKFYLLAAAIVSATTPALARDAKPVEAAPTDAAQTGSAATTARDARYCVVETVTGSIVRHKTCRTRAEWLRDGVDPLAK